MTQLPDLLIVPPPGSRCRGLFQWPATSIAFEITRNPAGGRSAHRVRTRSARNVCCGANVTIGPEVHPGRETMLTTP